MPDSLVLCYHAVSRQWPSPWAVTPEELEQQLRFLLRRGYRGCRFEEIVDPSVSDRRVAITFDDAYRSVFERARPILARLHLPGTVFVPTDPVEASEPMTWSTLAQWVGTSHEWELRPMSWDQLGQLAQEGWEIGSHTRSHPRLTVLDDPTLEEELRGSRRQCEQRLGRPCRSLAYPHGDLDARVVDAALGAGYRAAASVAAWAPATSPMRFPRVAVLRADDASVFRRKVSPLRRRFRSTPIWRGLRTLRQP